MWLERFFGRQNRQAHSASTSKAARRRPASRPLQVEHLEDRRLLSITAGEAGGVVTFAGDGVADTLTIDVSGGNLRHNRFTAGDGGYVDDFDFDSVAPGSQTVAANTVTSIAVTDTGGNDSVILAQIPGGGAGILTGLAGGATLSISDAATIADDGDVSIGGNAAFSGGAITLGSAAEATGFGSLTFGSTSAVTIQEDSGTSIAGANSALSLNLDSSGSITDAAGATIVITNLAEFNGASITLDNVGAHNFGQLTVNSAGAVEIEEADGTEIAGANTSLSLDLNSGGAISDAVGATLAVTNLADFNGTSITLDNAGAHNFGQLTFKSADAVQIDEADGTEIAGANTSLSLDLNSGGAISDAGGATVAVTNLADFNGTSITLDNGGAHNFGQLSFNSAGAVQIDEADGTEIAGANTGLSLDLNSGGAITDAGGATVVITNLADFNGTSIALDNAAVHAFGQLIFNSAGAVQIDEADGTEIAGANTGLSLDLDSGGAISDAGGATLAITNLADFNGASITLDNAASHTFGQLAFNSAGAVEIDEADGTEIAGANTALSLDLNSGGAITDAVGVTLAVTNLADFNGTSITLGDNVGDTTNFGSLRFVTTGSVKVTEDSSMLMSGVSTAANAITLGVADTAGPTDDFALDPAASVTSTTSNVVLNIGDDVSIPAGTLLSAAGTIVINVDNATVPGGDQDPGAGSTVDLGSNSVLVAPTGATITGGVDDDVFNVVPQSAPTLHIDGDDPAVAPGDTLNVDLSALTDAVIEVIPTTSGFASQLNATGVGVVSWMNIETFDALNAAFDLRVRMDLSNDLTLGAAPFSLPAGSGLGDDTVADLITAQMVGSDLQIMVSDTVNTPLLLLSLADIGSLEVVGSGDDDTLLIRETIDGLPSFTGDFASAPLSGGLSGTGHANTAFNAASGLTPTNVGMHFDGGAGTNAIDLWFTTDGASVSYFADNDHPGNSGNISVQGQYSLSFAKVTPIDILGGGVGSILSTDISSPAPGASTFLDIADDANGAVIAGPFGGLFGVPVAGDGVTAIVGDGGFETTRFANFGTVIVRSGVGAETITLHDIDAGAANPLANIILDGDDITQTDGASDTLHVRTLPAGVTAQLYGGAGADTFNLFDQAALGNAANTVDHILGQVTVSQAPPLLAAPHVFAEEGAVGDGDVLNIDDRGDNSGPGDDVWIGDDGVGAASKITNITGFATTNSFAAAGIDYGSGPVVAGPPSLHGQVETVNIWTSSTLGEQVEVEQTRDGSVYNLFTGGGDDTVNIFSDATTSAAPGAGNLNGIDGQVNVDTGAGINDRLNVSDFGDVNGDTYVFVFDTTTLGGATTAIEFADGTPDGATTPDIRFNVTEDDALENFAIWGGSGDDLFTNEGLAGGSRLQSSNPASEFMLAAHGTNATSNVFNGNGGNDTFTFEWASGFSLPALAALEINGDLPAAMALNRDVVNLRADAPADGVRTVGMTYQSAASGDVDVTGLHVGAGLINVNTAEQVNYIGDILNDDVVTVTGAAAGDNTLSVTPISGTEANVFLNGAPLVTIPPDAASTNNPGVAGGGTGPDINLQGLRTQNDATLTTSGLILQGVGNEDRLIVNATTESLNGSVGDMAATSGFGGNAFGSSSTVRPNNQAFDNVDVTDARVRIDRFDNTNAFQQSLIDVNIATGTFGRALATEAELTVNTGEEDGVRNSGIADDITVQLSTSFRFQINGGEPPLPGTPVLQGDRLNVAALTNGDINIHATDDPDGNTQAAPNAPNVSIFSEAGASVSEPVVWHSIEIVNVRPDDTTERVDILGDDNGNNPGQQDEIIIFGHDIDSTIATGAIAHPADADGANEFTVLINGSNPIGVYNTGFLNIYGAGGDDDVTIDPYANDVTGGWDIDVRVDGGAGNDDVFYGNIERELSLQPGVVFVDDTPDGSQAGVSEEVVLAPTTTVGKGQIRAVNSADGTDIVTIDFTTLEDVSFFFNDGLAGDNDSLTVLGTNRADVVTADFDNAGLLFDPTTGLIVSSADELIDIQSPAGTSLVQVHAVAMAVSVGSAAPMLSALPSVDFLLGNAADGLTVVGWPATPTANSASAVAPRALNIDGGPGSDRLVAAAGSNVVLIRKSHDGHSGSVIIDPAGAAMGPVAFESVEYVQVNSSGRVVEFDVDPFEMNDARQNATAYDLLSRTHVWPNIDPGGDEDWYSFVATEKSSYRFDLQYEPIVGLPSDLQLTVHGPTGILTPAGPGNDEFFLQKNTTYYAQVSGSVPTAVNLYNLEITDTRDDGTRGLLSPVIGDWNIDREGSNARYRGAADPKGNAIANFTGALLPASQTRSFEVTIKAEEKVAGPRWSNAFVVFDFDPSNLDTFKFAGAFKGIDRWAIGQSSNNANGYVASVSNSGRIDANTDYRIRVEFNMTDSPGNTTVKLFVLDIDGTTPATPKAEHVYPGVFSTNSVGLLTMRGIAWFDDIADPGSEDPDKPNAVPVARNDSAATAVGQAITIDVLANDTDNDGDVLAASLVAAATNGTVESNPDGSFVYTPQPGFQGTDSFTYKVNDGQADSEPATVSIVVDVPNQAPLAAADEASTDEDSAVTIGVLSNDTDPDGDPLSVVSFSQAAHGSVVRSGGALRYTPEANFDQTDSFSYTVSDGRGGTASATVEITVNPVNDRPVASDDSAKTDTDTPVTIDVISNDFDPEGDHCIVQSVTDGVHGTVIDNADGTVTFTPEAGYKGPDAFTYTIGDGNGGTASGTVSVQIGGLSIEEDFDDGVADKLMPQSGKWSISGNQYLAERQHASQNVISLLQVDDLLPPNLEFRVKFNADPIAGTRWSNAFIVFDYKSPTDYKFAGAFVGIDCWAVGRMTSHGYVMDGSLREQIDAGTDYELEVVLDGSLATLKVGGVTKVSHTYADSFQDGQLGLSTLRGNARFDDLSVKEL